MLDEPVRGSLPDPRLYSLTGLEQLRAYQRGQVHRPPAARLLGLRITQVSSGTVVVNVPISPWFVVQGGFIHLTALAENALTVAALTGAPPATLARTVNFSVRYLRPSSVQDEALIARGRILHAGSSFTTVEVLVEDAIGRAVGHATGSVLIRAIEPPPPKLDGSLPAAEEPRYPTPDPVMRPLPHRDVTVAASQDPNLAPLFEFFGIRFQEVADGRARAVMTARDWFCGMYREVQPGIIGTLVEASVFGAISTARRPNESLRVLNSTMTFLRPVAPDGQQVVATATVLRRSEDAIVSVGEVFDADGELVAAGHAAGLLVAPSEHRTGRDVERVLLTVLFTDVVGSTVLAARLGDEGWRALLEEHDALVRRNLELHKGRELKTTGDGFLAVFDSPTRAVRCASAIRRGMGQIGLEARVGIHTGECTLVSGDLSGVAVHVASRVQATAAPGEILVSSTVRDVIAGSGMQLTDRGLHRLKGLDGEWHLYSVEQSS